MKRIFLVFTAIIILIALSLVQEGFMTGLGSTFRLVNIPLFTALFVAVVFERQFAFSVFFVTSFIQALLSSQFLLLPLSISLGVCAFLTVLHEHFFTNRTLYALLSMGFIGWFIYLGLTFASTAASRALFFDGATVQAPDLGSLYVGAASLFMFLSMAYACTIAVSKRMKSYFIIGSS